MQEEMIDRYTMLFMCSIERVRSRIYYYLKKEVEGSRMTQRENCKVRGRRRKRMFRDGFVAASELSFLPVFNRR